MPPGTWNVYRSVLRIHLIPRLGSCHLADVECGDIVPLHHELGVTSFRANRTVSVLSRICTLNEVWRVRPEGSNLSRHVKRFREEERELFFLDEEYRRLGSALKESEEQGLDPSLIEDAIRLLMLTGCCKSGMLKLRWRAHGRGRWKAAIVELEDRR